MTSFRELIRVAIAGAASLRGKELKLWLEESNFPAAEILLLDEECVAGTLTEAGGEPAVIETVNEDSFERVRFAFFTGSAGFSSRHAMEARRAGAVVIDLTGGLAKEPGVMPWIPALDSVLPPPVQRALPGESQSLFLAPSSPADVAISLSAALDPMGAGRVVLTFFQSVSELGREGIEELEDQVIKLLSFQPTSQSIFGTQVGFNMLSSFGGKSSANLAAIRTSIVDEVRCYLAGRMPMPAISLVQAPVFYSHAFTAYADFESPPATEELVARLKLAGFKVVAEDDEAPNSVNVAGEVRPVLRQPERDPSIEHGVWFWGAADNMRVPVANASAIAEKLLAS